VQYFLGTCVRAVDFVDDQNRRQPCFKGLTEHIASLRERAFAGIDQQHYSIDHLQRALDFAAKVAVAGSVDNIYLYAFVKDCGVLRQNSDATLALELVRVHYAFDEILIGSERTALSQHGVDQRSFAVVDMGDDGDIADRKSTRLNSSHQIISYAVF